MSLTCNQFSFTLYQKSDERILGDRGSVKKVLAQVKENFDRKYHHYKRDKNEI